MTPGATFASTPFFRKAGLRETAVLLGLAWAVPFALHLVPWSGPRPLGVYLLPMFWTAFVATYLYGGLMGIGVGLFAPVVNLLVTGLPAGKYVIESSVELVVFALTTAWVLRRAPRLVLIAPMGYVVARLARAEWTVLTEATARSLDLSTVMAGIGRSLVNGLAGLLVLGAINFALVRFYPKTPRR